MRNKYTLSEAAKTLWAWTLTKVFFPGARLIRRPVYIRGKRCVEFGRHLTTGHACRFDLSGKGKTLIIGENCEMGDYTHIVAHEKVEIGDCVLIASKVFISDTNHGIYRSDNASSPFTAPNSRDLHMQSVHIGDNVWIGENAVILAGSRIGRGSIVGANSVVSGIFEENCIIAGVPAKVLKKWNSTNEEWERVK